MLQQMISDDKFFTECHDLEILTTHPRLNFHGNKEHICSQTHNLTLAYSDDQKVVFGWDQSKNSE